MPASEYLEPLRELFRHQMESFNYMEDAGLSILFDSIKLKEKLLMEKV